MAEQMFNSEKFIEEQIQRLRELETIEARIESMHEEELSQYRIIKRKRRTYLVPKSQEGIPVQEHLKKGKIPEDMKGAKVYMTDDGPVIVKCK